MLLFLRYSVLTLSLLSLCSFSASSQLLVVDDEVWRIHSEILTLDSHTDTPLLFGREGYDIGKRNDPRERGGKLDFPRMIEGGLDAVFFAVFVGQGERSPEGNAAAKRRALGIFSNIYQALEVNRHMAALALSANDAYQIKASGKVAVYIGLENAYVLGDDLSMVQRYYDMGARYIGLSHSRNNDVCDSSTDKPEHGGLTDFGEAVVMEMNRIGMMVDVSHISDAAFYDVLEITSAPVIASHSNARAVCDYPRNLNDDMLLALRENGGVVQLCLLSAYVKSLPPNPQRESALQELRDAHNNFQGLSDEEMAWVREEWYAINQKYPSPMATVSELVDHVDYIVDLIGIDHVGIGTDFDGGGALEDCFDVTELPNITRELLERGYSATDIEKIWSGNFMRVFKEVADARQVNE